jgi:hypothetical protein
MPLISTFGAASGRGYGLGASFAPTGIGVYGRRYSGYMSDNPNFFATATLSGTSFAYTNINSNWVEGGNNFSVEWLGYFRPNETGTWNFRTTSDDCSFLWIGTFATSGFLTSNANVNNGGTHGPETASGTAILSSGIYYPIRIQFGENTGGEAMTVDFAPPSNPTGWVNAGTGYYFYNVASLGF